jgi:hypothetical protein
MFPKTNIPDTNYPSYNYDIRTPDFTSFQQYENSGFLEIYPIITKIILDNLNKTETLAYKNF